MRRRSTRRAVPSKRAMLGLAASLALILSGPVPIMPGTAFAQEAPRYSVQLRDLSADRERFVNRMAARVSKDAIVVVYYGSNPAHIHRVRQGASNAKAEGFPVRGMILAKGDERYTIYADGLPQVVSVGELGLGTIAWTRNSIRKAYLIMRRNAASD